MTAETMEFKTELKQLLHLIIHSLYSHKDIFLRELISNASDAIDRVRFQSLTNAELARRQRGLEDQAHRRRSRRHAHHLRQRHRHDARHDRRAPRHHRPLRHARIPRQPASSANAEERPELIGQFGVGFYSAFMVADKVTVRSRRPASPRTASSGNRTARATSPSRPCDKPTRGTDVILHLKDDAKEFLEAWQLRQLVKKYSDFVEHPIVMDVETEENGEKKTVEETLNARKAIWLRNKTEVTEDEYNEFYKHLTHDTQDPARDDPLQGRGADRVQGAAVSCRRTSRSI